MSREFKLFILIVGLIGFAGGLSDSVLANYFKDVYDVNSVERGFIELPRELPGILGVIFIGILVNLGDMKISIVAMLMAAFGILVLGFTTPSFEVMLLFLFIYSMGIHVFMPLQDSIALSLSQSTSAGQSLGRMGGIKVAFLLCASILVFFGFSGEWLNFGSPIIIFIIAGIFYLSAAILLFYLSKRIKEVKGKRVKFKFVFRKEYTLYYLITILHGAQKQIMLVFAPWLLIELLGQGAATLSLILMISSLMGIFFLPAVGRWVDKFGIRKMLYVDGASFVLVYLFYGLLASAIAGGVFTNNTIPIILGCGMFVLDRLSMNLGMVKTMYLKNIAVDSSDITQTISLGISLDHIVSISCSLVSGYVWYLVGPEYVFYFASVLSLFNLVIAYYAKIKE